MNCLCVRMHIFLSHSTCFSSDSVKNYLFILFYFLFIYFIFFISLSIWSSVHPKAPPKIVYFISARLNIFAEHLHFYSRSSVLRPLQSRKNCKV